MAKEVVMPALGMAQETGLLMEWLKAEGDSVAKGEPLMIVETDKATEEIEANASGILANVTAAAGDEIPVGQVIALILAAGESAPQQSGSASTSGGQEASGQPQSASGVQKGQATTRPASPVAARIAADHDVDLAQVAAEGERVRKADVLAYLAGQEQEQETAAEAGRRLASPKARRLAAESNVELAAISGSGPDGAVLAADVKGAVLALAEAARRAAAEAATPETMTIGTMTMSRKWRVMATRLAETWRTVPHFYLKREADASRLRAWLESAQQRAEVKITYTDLLVKLTAAALKRHPRVNASWIDGEIVANPEINVGLAVAVEDGLVVPNIYRADRLTLGEIGARRLAVVAAAREGRLSLADLEGGTFTISNLGMFGIDEFSAIVNPPQAAILAVGRIGDKIVPVAGQPAVRPMMTLTLSCDHRVVDGARGARFLDTLARWIEDPLALLD